MKILFIIRSNPYTDGFIHEKLDSLLGLTLSEADISLLFLGEGIWLLQENTLQNSNFHNSFKLFSLYDIHTIYIDSLSLKERGILPLNFLALGKEVNTEEIQIILKEQQYIFTF